MKLSYYGYFLEHKKSKKRYQFDMVPFLKNFCAVVNPKYKNTFISAADEHVYLFKKTSNIFLLVMTKSHEIIKKIDTATIDVDEIYSKLGANDKLGFASYIYIGDCYYGIASTIQGPRNKTLTYFINDIIGSICINNYDFKTFAFLHQASKSEILTLAFIGKTIVQVGEGNSLFKHMVGFFGSTVEDIDSFVVEIRPKKRKSINKSYAKFSSKINDDGLMKYIVRAKADQEESLEDFYVACEGGVYDLIHGKDDSGIYKEIAEKAKGNGTLSDKINEIQNDKQYNREEIQAFAGFNKLSAWTNYLAGI